MAKEEIDPERAFEVATKTLMTLRSYAHQVTNDERYVVDNADVRRLTGFSLNLNAKIEALIGSHAIAIQDSVRTETELFNRLKASNIQTFSNHAKGAFIQGSSRTIDRVKNIAHGAGALFRFAKASFYSSTRTRTLSRKYGIGRPPSEQRESRDEHTFEAIDEQQRALSQNYEDMARYAVQLAQQLVLEASFHFGVMNEIKHRRMQESQPVDRISLFSDENFKRFADDFTRAMLMAEHLLENDASMAIQRKATIDRAYPPLANN